MAKLEDAIRAEYRSAAVYIDYHGGNEDAAYNRMIARWSSMITAFEIAFASGIVTGVEPEHCKCEGCVNWPCEGVCALTEHVETY